MELSIYNIEGKDTGRKVQLSDTVFGIEPNDHAIYLDVKQYLANQRQGTHKSKERNEIAGSTRKIKRQKGTGGARAGSIKSPLFRGGGRIFGPQPRDYRFKLNKKVKRLARLSTLTYKALKNEIIVIEDFTFEAPKTKAYVAFLNNLKISDVKTMLVLPEVDLNVIHSARNLHKAKVVTNNGLIAYNILNAKALVFTESSLQNLEQQFNQQ
ncbi:MAG: 50S ribosomal protein L4 [Salinivirgaceae bacterium]|jgi:large subunit ribosomal protein L4|nr:50S ribosomal protein L4 [Salinivirgaceae bacterium]MDD4745806.1 50S ribosomal protein L4 [Salinivirgaceae bacterium]MDY0279228.1 50S ribosomal protein L4 [Salinivirgaceae bacterium]